MRKYVFWAMGAIVMLGCVSLGLGIAVIYRQLPQVHSLADYRPFESSKVYSQDGMLVGSFFTQRRDVVAFAAIPPHVVHAFLAAEDAGFYDHEGIDYLGIGRALLKNMRPRSHLQGASTITQQTVKTLILGPERSYLRKVREALLARQMEQMLSKDEIFDLYLNQIYFGQGAYGIAEAAQTYFGKPPQKLSLGEGALLAALPKNPAHYNIKNNPAAAKARQLYVLRQMQAHSWATQQDVTRIEQQKVPYPYEPDPTYNHAPYYLEHVRRALVQRFGEARLLQGGLRIFIGMHANMQRGANIAMRQSLEDLGRKNKTLIIRRHIEASQLPEVLQQAHRTFAAILVRQNLFEGRPHLDFASMWDLLPESEKTLSAAGPTQLKFATAALTPYARTHAPVIGIEESTGCATVDLGSTQAVLPRSQLAWALGPLHRGGSTIGTILRIGDVVEVEIQPLPKSPEAVPQVALVPSIGVQGALVALDPYTHMVAAMVGGMPPDAGGFNRATQALRQPGSAFKPILYAAGLAARAISPASLCADSPVVYIDPWTGKSWKPENYESGRYDGNITYRTALQRSKNTCSVRLIQKLTPKAVIDMAHAMGIGGAMPENLTLSLGTGETTVLELCNAYATIAAAGQFADPVFIQRVEDKAGTVLMTNVAQPRAAIAPNVAYVLTSMMRSVIEGGTAARALQLQRPLAGKTGTSDNARDAWFAGFAPQLAAAVWVGNDDNQSLGTQTGASAALPGWIRFMGMALAADDPEDFVRPSDIATAYIDAKSGLISAQDTAREEVFVPGTEPLPGSEPLPSIFLQEQ